MTELTDLVATYWEREGVPALEEFVRVPSVSPAFSPDWERSGHLVDAVKCVVGRAQAAGVEGLEVQPECYPGRTPALLLHVRGTGAGRVLFYGHLDKQPAGDGWRVGRAFEPVIADGRLYGRGSVDDGYAVFTALGAVATLQRAGLAHPSCSVLLECGEESGSGDLSFYLDRFAGSIGRPDLVLVLDSEAGDYEHFWMTTSLRGIITGTLSVAVLTDSVHSGLAGGVVPTTFRIARQLLERIEDAATAEMCQELEVPIPRSCIDQAQRTAQVLGDDVIDKFPWVDGTRPLSNDPAQLLINNTWRPSLHVIGADGIPALEAAASTHRARTQLKLSIRIPPCLDASSGAAWLKKTFEEEPPSGASVSFELDNVENGWSASDPPRWLAKSVDRAAHAAFGAPPMHIGTGGTIPLVGVLGSRFPGAELLVTGVAGPGSNAHGPDEFLDLDAVRRLTTVVAMVLANVATSSSRED